MTRMPTFVARRRGRLSASLPELAAADGSPAVSCSARPCTRRATTVVVPIRRGKEKGGTAEPPQSAVPHPGQQRGPAARRWRPVMHPWFITEGWVACKIPAPRTRLWKPRALHPRHGVLPWASQRLLAAPGTDVPGASSGRAKRSSSLNRRTMSDWGVCDVA